MIWKKSKNIWFHLKVIHLFHLLFVCGEIITILHMKKSHIDNLFLIIEEHETDVTLHVIFEDIK